VDLLVADTIFSYHWLNGITLMLFL